MPNIAQLKGRIWKHDVQILKEAGTMPKSSANFVETNVRPTTYKIWKHNVPILY